MNPAESSPSKKSKFNQSLRGLRNEAVIVASSTVADPEFVRKAMIASRSLGVAFMFLGLFGWNKTGETVDTTPTIHYPQCGGDCPEPTPTPILQ